mgnify:CR=1 FL=1
MNMSHRVCFRSGFLTCLLILSTVSCSDTQVQKEAPTDSEVTPTLSIESPPDMTQPEVPILDWSPPPPPEPELTPEEICAQTSVLEVEAYCRCFPQCCQEQRWYCPPNPSQTIEAMEVVVEICTEDRVPCRFGIDEGCPPPEIISRSDCYVAYQCPPGSTGEFLQWFECQLEDGTFGRQRVLCNKGDLLHGPCRPCNEETCNGEDDDCDNLTDEGRFDCTNECGEGWGFCIESMIVDCTAPEPEEEVCDFQDNDCDDEIDEGQRNLCDDCGQIPPDTCDGIDNDCDGSTDEDLSQACETPCGIGVEFCAEGAWIGCTARAPLEEGCNGLDDDCDNAIDEELECNCSPEDVGTLIPCSEPPLVCGFGFKTCECRDPPQCQNLEMSNCQAICAFLPVRAPDCDPTLGLALPDEVCNNFDDNCNALIDEDLFRPCYTGPPQTINVGVCAPGLQSCSEGRWGATRGDHWIVDFCADEVIPAREICDGADNDCDGEVDYGEEVRETDILLIVDWSGSMDQEIDAVMAALSRFANQFAAEDAIHWGLIITPVENFNPNEFLVTEHLVLISDILPFNDFFQRLNGIGFPVTGSSEMLLDALYLSVRNISGTMGNDLNQSVWPGSYASMPPIENFFIRWREDSDRIIITFSDEPSLTYMRPENSRNIVQAAVADAANLTVYTFSDLGRRDTWDIFSIATNGAFFVLSQNAEQMYDDLVSIIDQACLPRDE